MEGILTFPYAAEMVWARYLDGAVVADVTEMESGSFWTRKWNCGSCIASPCDRAMEILVVQIGSEMPSSRPL